MSDVAELIEEHAKATADRLDKADVENATIKEQLTQVEAKMAGRPASSWASGNNETIGAQVIRSDAMGAMRDSGSDGVTRRIEVKSITNSETSAGSLHRPNRDEAVLTPRRPMRIRDLLRVVPVNSQDVEYPEQTQAAREAAPVAEGAAKPESAMAFEMKTVKTVVIAHWVTASRQALYDNQQLMALIDSDLRHGLELEEETQILNGSGTGQNLPGIVTNATAFSDPLGLTSPNQIDTIGAALLQADLTDVTADGIVINPIDWMRMRLAKDADGKYILGAPGANVPPVLFGRPVVATQAMAAGSFLVGPFEKGATLYDRMAATILMSSEHADFFTHNLLAILGEERVGLGVRRPGSFITGALPA